MPAGSSSSGPSVSEAGGDRRAALARKPAVLAVIAPVVLLVVAARQATLAVRDGLSPWKGGGFGMFSTVDAPSSRFLRIYLVGPGTSERPVLLPMALEEEARQVRTLPTPSGLSGLAKRLARGQWYPLRIQSALDYYRRLGGRGHSVPGEDDLVGSADLGPLTTMYLPNLELDLYRMLEPGETPNPRRLPLRFERVRVELWRYEFGHATPGLRSTLLLNSVATPEPGAP